MSSHEAADPRRAVLILIDGARPDVLQSLLDRGDLPHLARWVWFFGALGLVVPIATRALVTYVVAAIAVGAVIMTYQRGRAGAASPSLLSEPRPTCDSLPS